MNQGTFTGRVAKAPNFRDGGKTPVCYLTLIRNEYAGRDEESGDVNERKVAIPFTVFGKKAKAIADNAYVGDQLIVSYRLANNDREVEGGTEYGFSFIVDDFEFGAPGELKRDKLAQQGHRGARG
ncbi:MAG: single-stranded DNA-binding protein [Burkholderiaceae bacterium]|nr:single-stranded DNA-binding protein [Burkholderiaceae bacterium]